MIRLANHVEEHAAMDRALAKLRATARPVEDYPGTEPVTGRPPSRLAAVAGFALIGSGACFLLAVAAVLIAQLDRDAQQVLARTLIDLGFLALGVVLVLVAVGECRR